MLPGVCLIAVVVLMELLIKNKKRGRAGGVPPAWGGGGSGGAPLSTPVGACPRWEPAGAEINVPLLWFVYQAERRLSER